MPLAACAVLTARREWQRGDGQRTRLEPLDDTYDVGLVANVKSVLGERPALWLLPLPGTAAAGDGLTWPRRAATTADDDERRYM